MEPNAHVCGGGPHFMTTCFMSYHEKGCPNLRAFRRVGTSDDGIRGVRARTRRLFRRNPENMKVRNELEIDVRGAHSSKTATSGAASVVVLHETNARVWARQPSVTTARCRSTPHTPGW